MTNLGWCFAQHDSLQLFEVEAKPRVRLQNGHYLDKLVWYHSCIDEEIFSLIFRVLKKLVLNKNEVRVQKLVLSYADAQEIFWYIQLENTSKLIDSRFFSTVR